MCDNRRTGHLQKEFVDAGAHAGTPTSGHDNGRNHDGNERRRRKSCALVSWNPEFKQIGNRLLFLVLLLLILLAIIPKI
jgi:hypothetical protein